MILDTVINKKFAAGATTLALLLSCTLPAMSATAAPIPKPKLKIPDLVKEVSISTYVPSSVAPGKGLAVNVIYPESPRYSEGAPIAVVVPGGQRSDGLATTTHTAQQGFAEVRFAFPGGGTEAFGSTGDYDSRGPICQIALKDVLLFALGKTSDYQGRTIKQLVPSPVTTNNVGILGWSNGGNIALVTMGKYAKELKDLAWICLFESPVGPLFYPGNLGSALDQFVNKHYREGSSATGQPLVDWRKIAYQANAQKMPGEHKKFGEPEIEGVVFFDDNKNGIWDETTEFALSYATDSGVDKQFYPPEATKALLRFHVDPGGWLHIANPEEAENYFNERDGSLYVKDICEAYPNLLVTLVGTQIDHYQRQNDHPHIGYLYNAFLTKKIRFLCLNPDPRYVAKIANMNVGNFVDNKVSTPLDASNMDAHMEPEGIVPDYVYTEAAVAELADRRRNSAYAELAKAPLIPYPNNGTEAPPAPSASVPKLAPVIRTPHETPEVAPSLDESLEANLEPSSRVPIHAPQSLPRITPKQAPALSAPVPSLAPAKQPAAPVSTVQPAAQKDEEGQLDDLFQDP